MPSLNGSAALPSVVDIYVNDAPVGSRDLKPGPFQVVDAPIVSGNGEVNLVVRDMLGRETLVRQSYYNAPGQLRAGLHDRSEEHTSELQSLMRISYAVFGLITTTHEQNIRIHIAMYTYTPYY